MKARFVNPFINAAIYTLHQFFSETMIDRGTASVVSTLPSCRGIAAELEFFGELEGQVIYFLDRNTCLDIASELNDSEIKELGEIARETVSELANIITGQSAIRLQAEDCEIDISTPSLHVGIPADKWQFDSQKIIHYPLRTDYGDLEIHLLFEG